MNTPAPAVGDVLRLWHAGHWGFVNHEVRALLTYDEQVVRRYMHPEKQWWIYEAVHIKQHQRDQRRNGLNPEQERP